MKISNKAYKRAKKLVSDKEKIDTCVKAGICPTCSSNLHHSVDPALVRGVAGGVMITTYCSNNKNHIEFSEFKS